MAVKFEYRGVKYENAVQLAQAMPLLTSVLVAWSEDAEVILANAAGLCYDTEIKWNEETRELSSAGKRIIKHCRDSKHNTVLEHGVATFVKKVPIFVARQDLRARIASFDERSLRYCRADNGTLTYYIPDHLTEGFIDKVENPEYREKLRVLRERWIEEHERAIEFYSDFTDEELNGMWDALGLDSERIRETSRAVLPLGINTMYMDTRNIWSWYHHASKRLCLRAQKEIRKIRVQEVSQLRRVFPTVFGDVNMPCYMWGGCPERKTCGLIELHPYSRLAMPYHKKVFGE